MSYPSRHRNVHRLVTGAGVVLFAVSVVGCASIAERISDADLIAPGKFDHLTCQDVADREKTVRERYIELEQLMARSAQGVGGEFVNAVAYRTDYLLASGELKVLAQAAADKNCASKSPYSSRRSIL